MISGSKIVSPKEFLETPPARITKPAEHGLFGNIKDLEFQLGTIEAYHYLIFAAKKLRDKIDRNEVKSADSSTNTKEWHRSEIDWDKL